MIGKDYKKMGYQFQDFVAAIIWHKELSKFSKNESEVSKIIMEGNKNVEEADDKFDDIYVYGSDDIKFKYQVKHTDARDEKVSLERLFFSNKGVREYSFLKETEYRLVVGIRTNQKIIEVEKSKLELITDNNKVFSGSTSYKIRDCYWNEYFNGRPLQNFIIEVKYGNAFEETIFKNEVQENEIFYYTLVDNKEVITERYMNDLLSLIQQSNTDYSRYSEYTKLEKMHDHLLQYAQLAKYKIPINQDLQIDANDFITRKQEVNQIIQSLEQDPFLWVVGDPGSGKTWITKSIIDEYKSKSYNVLRYYLHFNHQDADKESRLDKFHIFSTIATEALRDYSLSVSRYETSFEEIKNKILKDKESNWLLIIDGLDHITREPSNIDVSAFTEELISTFKTETLNFKMIFLSQRILKYKKYPYFELNGFSEFDKQELFSKNNLSWEEKKTLKEVGNNPLLLKYNIENIKRKIKSSIFTTIDDYYRYLLEKDSAESNSLRNVALSPMPLTLDELAILSNKKENILSDELMYYGNALVEVTGLFTGYQFFHESLKRYIMEILVENALDKDELIVEVSDRLISNVFPTHNFQKELKYFYYYPYVYELSSKKEKFFIDILNYPQNIYKLYFTGKEVKYSSINEMIQLFFLKVQYYYLSNYDYVNLYKFSLFSKQLTTAIEHFDTCAFMYCVYTLVNGDLESAKWQITQLVKIRIGERVVRDLDLQDEFRNYIYILKLNLEAEVYEKELLYFQASGVSFLNSILSLDQENHEFLKEFNDTKNHDVLSILKKHSLKLMPALQQIKIGNLIEFDNKRLGNFDQIYLQYILLGFTKDSNLKIIELYESVRTFKLWESSEKIELLFCEFENVFFSFENDLELLSLLIINNSHASILIDILSSTYSKTYGKIKSFLRIIIAKVVNLLSINKYNLQKESINRLVGVYAENFKSQSNYSNIELGIILDLIRYIYNLPLEGMPTFEQYIYSFGSWRDNQVEELECYSKELIKYSENYTMVEEMINISYYATRIMDKDKDVWHVPYGILDTLLEKNFEMALNIGMNMYISTSGYFNWIESRFSKLIKSWINTNTLTEKQRLYLNYMLFLETCDTKILRDAYKISSDETLEKGIFEAISDAGISVYYDSESDEEFIKCVIDKYQFPKITLKPKRESNRVRISNTLDSSYLTMDLLELWKYVLESENQEVYEYFISIISSENMIPQELFEYAGGRTGNDFYNYVYMYKKSWLKSLNNQFKTQLLVLIFINSMYHKYLDFTVVFDEFDYDRNLVASLLSENLLNSKRTLDPQFIWKYLISDDKIDIIQNVSLPHYYLRLPNYEAFEIQKNDCREGLEIELLILILESTQCYYYSCRNYIISKVLENFNLE